MTDPHLVSLLVNGTIHEVVVEPRRTLADVLRHDLGYTGTHLGCEHGICGACTVLLDGQPVRSCLIFGVQADGCRVQTVEGLTSGGAGRGPADGEGLNDLQEAFSRHHALQCGYCTPGMLMLAEALLSAVPEPSAREVREVMAANLCRCTGYQGIVEAVVEVGRARAARRPG
jgi:aerobic-type carbon monoxide dehydrogenase small subunit (CoxS/CutS family)